MKLNEIKNSDQILNQISIRVCIHIYRQAKNQIKNQVYQHVYYQTINLISHRVMDRTWIPIQFRIWARVYQIWNQMERGFPNETE